MVLSSFLFVTLRFLLGHALLFQKSGFLLLAQHLFGSMFFVAQHAININSLFIYTRLLLHIFSFNCCRDHKQAAVFKRYKELSSRGRARTKWYFTVHRLSRRSEIVAESKLTPLKHIKNQWELWWELWDVLSVGSFFKIQWFFFTFYQVVRHYKPICIPIFVGKSMYSSDIPPIRLKDRMVTGWLRGVLGHEGIWQRQLRSSGGRFHPQHVWGWVTIWGPKNMGCSRWFSSQVFPGSQVSCWD